MVPRRSVSSVLDNNINPSFEKTSFIKNNDIRASLSNNISTIKTSVTGKTVLATALKGFSLNP